MKPVGLRMLLLLLTYFFIAAGYCQKIAVRFTRAASTESFTGKVYLYLSKFDKEPRNGAVGMEAFPCYSVTVKNVKPGQPIVFNDAAKAYPVALSDIERGTYYVQAVWDKNAGGRSIGNSSGNLYNAASRITFTKNTATVHTLICEEIVKPTSFIETETVKEIKLPSLLLSDFHKKSVSIDAAILLPKDYATQPDRRFPVLYYVSGFGGDYHRFSGEKRNSRLVDTTQAIQVYLDGNCPLGHSVYANSDNNGPWGDALTQELIPFIEKKFRTNKARLLTGHSSGGWTVLWLQTQYPKIFTACWASAPDPVDFRTFCNVDLYKRENLFYANDSSLRMIAVIGGQLPWVSTLQMAGMENVIERGEQLNSFNAVFSQRLTTGKPRPVCNPLTGMVDTATVAHWKKYDISANLRQNWPALKADLQGKIRISVGNHDNFFLNRSVKLLERDFKDSTAIIFAYYPGDHFTVNNPEYMGAGYKFLQGKYNEFMLKEN